MSVREHAEWCPRRDRIGVRTYGRGRDGTAKIVITKGTCGCHLSRTATLLRRLARRAERREAS